MTEATVHVKTEERPSGCVATVTIDNQQRLNCLASPAIISLRQAFEKLSEDASLRAIILTGAGDKAFIGGADLRELGAADPDSVRLFITRLHQACLAIRDCPVPVIGRINGFCLGAGLEGCAMERVHLFPVLGLEADGDRGDGGQVLGLLEAGPALAHPEVGLAAAAEAGGLAVLHHQCDAERREHLGVERLGAFDVGDVDADVIEDRVRHGARSLADETAPGAR